MKSKLRPLTILLALILIAMYPYGYVRKGPAFSTPTDTAEKIFLIFSVLLLLAMLFGIWRMTLLVRIDPLRQAIIFTYPFRLSRRSYHFDEMIGFRWGITKGRYEYKFLQFKTRGGRKFIISDFETMNLREIEAECLKVLPLRGRQFEALDEEQQAAELEKSRQFDIRQAREIRSILYFAIGGMLVIAVFRFSQEFLIFTAIVILGALLKLRQLKKPGVQDL